MFENILREARIPLSMSERGHLRNRLIKIHNLELRVDLRHSARGLPCLHWGRRAERIAFITALPKSFPRTALVATHLLERISHVRLSHHVRLQSTRAGLYWRTRFIEKLSSCSTGGRGVRNRNSRSYAHS